MIHAEKFNLIAPEQFGSRKNHSCIDQVIVKRLYYDALRFLRMNGFLCSNDAKSCYDRIVHSMASLAMQRVGMPKEPIICMLTSLQNMTHYIRTAHGLSSQTYGGNLHQGKPVQGSGQGNGASPSIWTLISSPLLSMMKQFQFGVKFNTPISNQPIQFVGCSFVDDTDLLQTGRSVLDPLETIQPVMQRAIDAWSTGLRATGGALVPDKCWLYPISFNFDPKGNFSYTSVDQLNLQFTVPDATLIRQPLTLISPHEAKETLGVYLAPDGNERLQIQHLKSKVAQWVEKVRTNRMSKHHASLALSSTIFKTLEYPAPALSISQPQWTTIMAPLAKCGLHIKGICATLPKIVREGPVKHMGVQIKCMYKQQEILKLEKYLFFREHPGIVGQMIRMNEELLTIELGIPGNIFAVDYKRYHSITTPSWIRSIWKFVYDFNINIQMRTTALAPTKTDDIFLMEAFVNQGYKNKK